MYEAIMIFSDELQHNYQKLTANQQKNFLTSLKSLKYLGNFNQEITDNLVFNIANNIMSYSIVEGGAQFILDVFEDEVAKDLIFNDEIISRIYPERLIHPESLIGVIESGYFNEDKQKATQKLLDLLIEHKQSLFSTGDIFANLEFDQDYIYNRLKEYEEICPHLERCREFLSLNLQHLNEAAEINPDIINLKPTIDLLEKIILKLSITDCTSGPKIIELN